MLDGDLVLVNLIMGTRVLSNESSPIKNKGPLVH